MIATSRVSLPCRGRDLGTKSARAGLDQAACDGLQHLVTGLVTQAVVHALEAVQVDEQHAGASALRRAQCRRVVQLLFEAGAVGQARECVLVGALFVAAGLFAQLGHVHQREEVACRRFPWFLQCRGFHAQPGLAMAQVQRAIESVLFLSGHVGGYRMAGTGQQLGPGAAQEGFAVQAQLRGGARVAENQAAAGVGLEQAHRRQARHLAEAQGLAFNLALGHGQLQHLAAQLLGLLAQRQLAFDGVADVAHLHQAVARASGRVLHGHHLHGLAQELVSSSCSMGRLTPTQRPARAPAPRSGRPASR
jgi:hypothetical protein